MSVSGLPIHGARIHRPQLRDDVLSRERLNGWLDRAALGRVGLIVAEAGFGKTTLLADWSRHTPRRTIWYRLEPDDRDWLTFLRHLVGSGIEVDAAFAPETLRLLTAVGPGGPTRPAIVDSLLRELAEAGARDGTGFTLIFDDYHHIDGSDETDPIVRALVERTGPGFSILIATRVTPQLPLGRLRARGGLARLDGDALCFDRQEADRLFREAYHHPLDPDIIDDLHARTEGWAALLSLVRTSIEERGDSDVRLLAHQLSGVRSDVYDFLAEEVVAGLPDRLRQFLLRVSILAAVDPTAARVADPDAGHDCERLIQHAERLRLLVPPDRYSAHRFHPLVRDFLLSRLVAEIGPAEVRERHLSLARHFESLDWRVSAGHYISAGDHASVERVIDASVETILASGQFEEARHFIQGGAASERPVALVLRSRLAVARGNLPQSTSLAEKAIHAAVAADRFVGMALLNLASVKGVTGFADDAVEYARRALSHQLTPSQRDIAEATIAMWEASREGDLSAVADKLAELAARQGAAGHRRYVGVTKLNLAAVLYWQGNVNDSLARATEAEDILIQLGADGVELVSAIAARANALAHLRRMDEAERALDRALASRSPHGRTEALLESARMAGHFGDLDRGTAVLEAARHAAELSIGMGALWALASGELALRKGDTIVARRMLEWLSENPCNDIAGRLRAKLLRARSLNLAGDASRGEAARDVVQLAKAQRSRPGLLIGEILVALANDDSLGVEITQLGPTETALLSLVAEELSANLHRLSPRAERVVIEECLTRPARWASALRLVIGTSGPSRLAAASLLSQVGTAEELPLLRSLATESKAARPHAVALARRVAPRVMVNDLGPVTVSIRPDQQVRGLRRKVMGLLCYLISRTSMAATRDEVLDALWPELSPDTATNSLNQTIYFLRRVFEPDYREGVSAGYVRFDGDMVSLDPELIDSASRLCRRLLARTDRAQEELASELVNTYAGRFALDFVYEEWATDYRETLHAAVLAHVEGAAQAAFNRREFEAAISLAQAMLAVAPEADSLELILLLAYRVTGRSAAAAEQYAHYASVQREQLGLEPPPLEAL